MLIKFVCLDVQFQLLKCYGTAQFKLDIYMRVTQDFLDKFLVPLTSYMRENHYNIHLHVCHSRVA